MNLAALREQVRELTNFRMSSLVSDARIDAAVNEAYMQVAAAEPWTWLVSSSTATVSPSSPAMTLASCRQVLTVALSDGARTLLLDRSSRTSADWLVPSGTVPALYAFVQPGQLLIQPVPDKAYACTVQFIARVAALGASDSPVFASEYHAMLAYAAAASLLVQEVDETSRAQAYASFYMGFLDRMRDDDNHTSLTAVQMGAKPRIRPRRRLARGY